MKKMKNCKKNIIIKWKKGGGNEKKWENGKKEKKENNKKGKAWKKWKKGKNMKKYKRKKKKKRKTRKKMKKGNVWTLLANSARKN